MTANNKANNSKIESDLHRAAIIDEHGREIPITRKMIDIACENLEYAKKDVAAKPSS